LELPRGMILVAFIFVGLAILPWITGRVAAWKGSGRGSGGVAGGRQGQGQGSGILSGTLPAGVPYGAANAAGTERIFYGPANDLEEVDGRLLRSAASTLDIAMYSFTDMNLCRIVAAASLKGAKVRVYRDGAEYAKERGRQAGGPGCMATLLAGGVSVRVKPEGELMHLKSYAIDGVRLRSGSANLSRSGEQRQDNDLILIQSSADVKVFEAEFEAMWKRPDNLVVGQEAASQE